MTTKSQIVATDVAALLRSRAPLLWVSTREEARVERILFKSCEAAGFIPRTWDAAQGVCNLAGKPETFGTTDAEAILGTIDARSKSTGTDRCVWILRDFHKFLGDNPIFATVERRLRNLVRSLPGSPMAQAIIILTPSGTVPEGLAGHTSVIEWPLPDRIEIGRLLDSCLSVQPKEVQETGLPDREGAIDAAAGLTGEQAENCFAASLARFKKVDPVAVAKEKKRIIGAQKGLEWHDPIPGGLDAVGGLDALKTWLVERSSAYSPEARAYGLPAPKGGLAVGVPGCGKSLTGKAIASAWNFPLLRFDLNALKSKFVGDSEGGLRAALKIVEAIGKCILWVDEIEKVLQGATSGSADGGVSADALGQLLTWMEERKCEAFLWATANDAAALPPELLRRFDGVWWVDLPTPAERCSIIEAALRAHGRPDLGAGLAEVAAVTDGFSGSEIAKLVPAAMFVAFRDGKREITIEDLVAAAKRTKPLYKGSTKVEKLREWQRENGALAATTPAEETEAQAVGLRVVEF